MQVGIDDYWTQKTSFYSDHALKENLLFRFVNESNWFISKSDIETVHGPSIIQTINKYNSVSYNFRGVMGLEKQVFHHLASTLSLDYRHGAPSKRIFLDIIPSYTYPRSLSYSEIRTIEFRLEYYFGDID